MSAKPGPDTTAAGGFSLRRWSRRKLDAAREAQSTEAAAALPKTLPADSTVAAAPATSAAPPRVELPPIESLTLESDFTVFFQPQVDESLKRAALKQLFRDPRFNVMDGLDIYVGDYTKSDPIPDHIIQQLVQARAIFNPPKTMLTPEGYVVDVPLEDVALPADAKPAALGDPATTELTGDASGLPSVLPRAVPTAVPFASVAQSPSASDASDAAPVSPQSAHSTANTTAKS
jgi:Protein of unknown function (DUF3306)